MDWSTVLAVGSQQSSGSVGIPFLQTTSLLSLRNFTTEQRGTTVLCVRKLDKVNAQGVALPVVHLHVHSLNLVQVVIMADGQVTRGNEIVKPNVKKVRKLNDSVIGGFAGLSLCCSLSPYSMCGTTCIP